MRLYFYVVTHDTGFAPNPFYGYCTLATCMRGIRQRAEVGDWVLGVGSIRNSQDGKLLYAMKVEEILSFDDYWTHPRFQSKKPSPNGTQESQRGDNLYHRDPRSGDWIQALGDHSKNGCQDPKHVENDTKSPRVLVSRQFIYYGKSAVDIPSHILLYGGENRFTRFRNYRCNFPSILRSYILKWLQDLIETPGIQDTPTHWDSTNSPSC